MFIYILFFLDSGDASRNVPWMNSGFLLCRAEALLSELGWFMRPKNGKWHLLNRIT